MDVNAPHAASRDDSAARTLAVSADAGGRRPGGFAGRFLTAVAVSWTVFQIWVASPLPFYVSRIIPVFNLDDIKIVHISFAFFLAFAFYPARKTSPRHVIPPGDWALCALAPLCALYLLFFKEDLAGRSGAPVAADLIVAGAGMVFLLEAARRALGIPLVAAACVFLLYVFFGSSEILPEAVRWKGASFQKAMSHMWLSTEGVFGVALGVSASFVFLFVFFGLLLEGAGAGNYIIQLSFSLLGRFRGGPAKAAVAASALTGMISGSSTANVVTTGTFTIPLMRRVGFSAEKAGAVEVASSTNGQLTPPIMGAAAFLMVEYVGVSYLEVIKHAFLPAVISYIALVYIVHLEAVKAGMDGLPAPRARGTAASFLFAGINFSFLLAFLGGSYFILSGLKQFIENETALTCAVIALILAAYFVLLRMAAKQGDLIADDPSRPPASVPDFSKVWRTGAYFGLPVFALVWFLMVERKSPGLSVFWAAALLAFVVLTHKPAKAILRGADAREQWREGLRDFARGLAFGARNMISIAVATAAAGIIVGAVTLTGMQQFIAEFIETLSGGSLPVVLVLVAVFSLILGMGLPTTANYIVVSSLMAGVIVELGAHGGLVVPLIAAHLFVFYFGILADDTPPVGLGAFAAAAISGGDPIKTGFQGFAYDIRTAILPFLFIFNTDLLLIDVGFFGGVAVFISALAAMLLFAAATQGWFLARSKLWETAALLLIAFTLFRPGFWLDRAAPPFLSHPPAEITAAAAKAENVRIRVSGEDISTGKTVHTTVLLPLGAAGEDGARRLSQNAGMELREEDGRVFVDALEFGGVAANAGLDLDWEILALETPDTSRPPKQVFWIPALLLLAFVARRQQRRGEKN
ncbi:MAG: TRAP transporter permease [Gammaproteobacteria bacterium]